MLRKVAFLALGLVARTAVAGTDQMFANLLKGLQDPKKIVKSIGSEKPKIMWDDLGEDPQKVAEAGLVLTLTSAFFDECHAKVIDIFTRSLTRFQINDYCTDQSLGTLLTGHLCVTNQKTLNFSVDTTGSTLKIKSAANALKLHV